MFGESIQGRHISGAGSGIGDAWRLNGFPQPQKLPENSAYVIGAMGERSSARRIGSRSSSNGQELPMRIRIFASAALAVAIGAPIAAQAQGVTVGVAPGPGVAVTESEGIAVDQRP